MSRRGRLAAALGGVALAALGLGSLAGCSVNPATGDSEFTGFMTAEEEAEIGRREDPRLTAQFDGAYPDPALQAYVREIGARLVRVSETPDAPYRFKVLNHETVNAFALPGGYVYVTRGLMALASDEAELAGVLGHEIGHVVARHSAQRRSRAQATDIGLTVFGAVAGVFGAPIGTGAVTSFGAEAVLKGYSRDQEHEADMLGLRYMRRAGYDGAGMVRFLDKLARAEAIRGQLDPSGEGDALSALMATHPHTDERLEAVRKILDADAGAGGVRRRDGYLDRIDGLLYGRDRGGGAIQEGRYVGLEDDLAFDVPPGFRLARIGDTLTGQGPEGAILAVDSRAAPGPAPRDLTSYVASVWAAELEPRRVESLRIGPYHAATAGVRAVTAEGRTLDLRFVVLRRPDSRRMHRFLLTMPPAATPRLDALLRRVVASARPPSPAEAWAAARTRIDVVAVDVDTTRAGLLELMADVPLAGRRFDAINGLAPGAEPVPGSRVKLISRGG